MKHKYGLSLLLFVILLGTTPAVVLAQSSAPAQSPAPSLAAPSDTTPSSDAPTDANPNRKAFPGFRQLLFTIGALALLFVGLILLLKQLKPKEAGPLPTDVFEILGHSPLALRQQVYFLRCGNRVFIVSLSQNGVDQIGEITDPAEVDRISRRCHGEVVLPLAERLMERATERLTERPTERSTERPMERPTETGTTLQDAYRDALHRN